MNTYFKHTFKKAFTFINPLCTGTAMALSLRSIEQILVYFYLSLIKHDNS